MRRGSLLILLVFLAAGCGGGKSTQTSAPATTATPVMTTSGDPGHDAFDALVAAARSGNTAALWRLLSTASH